MVEESLTYDKQIRKIRKANKEKYGNALKDGEFICGFRRKDRLALVFTLVLYWGDKEWDAATSLQDMIDIPAANHNMEEKFRKLAPNYQIRVFDLNSVKDFSNFKTTLRTVFEFYSHRRNKEELKKYLAEHEEEVNALDEESCFLLAAIIKEKQLVKHLLKQKNEREEENMCQAIQEMIEDGRLEGKAEAVLILLEEKGKIDDKMYQTIREQTNEEILKNWLKLAAKAKNISDFKMAM